MRFLPFLLDECLKKLPCCQLNPIGMRLMSGNFPLYGRARRKSHGRIGLLLIFRRRGPSLIADDYSEK